MDTTGWLRVDGPARQSLQTLMHDWSLFRKKSWEPVVGGNWRELAVIGGNDTVWLPVHYRFSLGRFTGSEREG